MLNVFSRYACYPVLIILQAVEMFEREKTIPAPPPKKKKRNPKQNQKNNQPKSKQENIFNPN